MLVLLINEGSVKSRFCSIHFTIISAGLRKIVRYIEVRFIEVPLYINE